MDCDNAMENRGYFVLVFPLGSTFANFGFGAGFVVPNVPISSSTLVTVSYSLLCVNE